MLKVKSREFVIVVLLINACIPFMIGNQNTYFYVRHHLRALSEHLTTIPAQSKLECAWICEKNEKCGIANYDNIDSLCELVQERMDVSEIVTNTTIGWHLLGKRNSDS